MQRIVLALVVSTLCLTTGIASAKLPFFGFEVTPLNPDVGEPIAITMTCFEDTQHTRPSSSYFGAGDSMAWIHPLDDEGTLDRDDWIPVAGHATASGTVRGRIVLDEPGDYDVLPLWRTWDAEAREGFPGAIRMEVGRRGHLVTLAVVTLGVAAAGLVAGRRRRLRRPAASA